MTLQDLLTDLLLALDTQDPHIRGKRELYKKTWKQGYVGSLYTHSCKQSPGHQLLLQTPFQGAGICWERYAWVSPWIWLQAFASHRYSY